MMPMTSIGPKFIPLFLSLLLCAMDLQQCLLDLPWYRLWGFPGIVNQVEENPWLHLQLRLRLRLHLYDRASAARFSFRCRNYIIAIMLLKEYEHNHDYNMAPPQELDRQEQDNMSKVTGKSFHDLPKFIRRRIYIETGVYSNESILLQKRRELDSWPRLKLTLNLLLVSRIVSKEVEQLLFSENELIAARGCSDHQLQSLTILSDNALASFKVLTVSIRFEGEANCHCEYLACCNCSGKKTRRGKPLSITSRCDRQVISRWRSVVRRLAACASSDLCLKIYCDTEDLTTAREVVRPLEEMPTIRSFAIRLAKGRNKPSLQELAETTLLRMTGKPLTPPTFHGFDKLPKELRLRILSCTDLVFPLTTNWHDKKKFFRAPGTCNDFHGCLCNAHHCAASTKCNCHSKPQSLLLVSRQMNHEASEVFYRQNTFLLAPHNGDELKLFFGYLNQNAQNNLRSLRLIVDSFFSSYGTSLSNYKSMCKRWEIALESFSKRATVQKLDIIIHFDNKNEAWEHEYESVDDVPEGAWNLEPYRKSMERVVQSLAKFDAVHGVGVEIHWPEPLFLDYDLEPRDPEEIVKIRSFKRKELWKGERTKMEKHLAESVLGEKFIEKETTETHRWEDKFWNYHDD